MCKTTSAPIDSSLSAVGVRFWARASLARDGRGSAIRVPSRAQRGDGPSRRGRGAPRRGRLPRRRFSCRFARLGRSRSARRRGNRARARAPLRAAAPSARADGAHRDHRRRRADRLGRDLDRLVDCRRSLMGLARPGPRLPRVPRTGLLAGALFAGARRLASLLAVVVAAAIGWALLGVAIPSLFPDGDRIARLREPVGYWNALALLADGAIACGLWLASERRPGHRVAGAMLVYGGRRDPARPVTAGVVGAVAVVVLWLVLSRERLVDALRLVVFAGPGLAVGAWAFTRPASSTTACCAPTGSPTADLRRATLSWRSESRSRRGSSPSDASSASASGSFGRC